MVKLVKDVQPIGEDNISVFFLWMENMLGTLTIKIWHVNL